MNSAGRRISNNISIYNPSGASAVIGSPRIIRNGKFIRSNLGLELHNKDK
ncbi:hypothetical protein ASZ90_007096 [hydrocarbon metagenome]|uniref:Uncharacterized protein n=1 Tax=hydrocarbon metagenome TaxID=938273 RepID=A0A0W8FR32_9ZZZZ